VGDWEKEREGEETKEGREDLLGHTLESLSRETKGEGREMSTLL